MDKKFLVKAIIFNTCWVLWIALSVVFGYLIADSAFPDNILVFIPLSLAFMTVGGVAAFIVYRKLFKREKGNSPAAKAKADDMPESEGNDADGENISKQNFAKYVKAARHCDNIKN